jgi:hypothetical protein
VKYLVRRWGDFLPEGEFFSPSCETFDVATPDVAPVGAVALPTAGRPADKEENMSRGTLRPVLAGLALVLVLALASPARGEAASLGDQASGWSVRDFVPQWVMGLLEKIGWPMEPAGSAAPVTPSTDSGYSADPNG